MKRFFSSWQGLGCGAVALALYLVLPVFLRWYDPTAGLFDAGYLQWVGLATVLAFWTVFVGWVCFQIAFPSVDKQADRHIGAWFQALSDREKWYVTQSLFVLMLLLFLVCLVIVPL